MRSLTDITAAVKIASASAAQAALTMTDMQAQAGEKRSSDKRAHDLEIRISSIAAARAQSDKSHGVNLQVCDAPILCQQHSSEDNVLHALPLHGSAAMAPNN